MRSTVRLSDIADSGQYGLNAAALKAGKGIRFIRITDINESGRIGDADPAYVDAKVADLSRYELSPGDVLIARSGATAGKSLLYRGLPEPAVFAGYLLRFRPRLDHIVPEYLAYFLQSPRYWQFVRATARAVAQPNINARELASLPIPLRPIDDQRRVVAHLSRAETIMRMRKEAATKAKEVIPALFIDMFGDPARNAKSGKQLASTNGDCRRAQGMVLRLGDVIEKFEGGKNLQSGVNGESPYRILKISAVTSGTYNETESKPAPGGYSPPSHYIVRQGDILFSRANTEELVGATAMVHQTDGKSLLPDKLWRLVWRDSESISPVYMLALLQSRGMRSELSKIASGTGGSMKNISQARLAELRLSIAPIQEQRAFERHAARISSVVASAERATAQASQVFQSLLVKVFGEGA